MLFFCTVKSFCLILGKVLNKLLIIFFFLFGVGELYGQGLQLNEVLSDNKSGVVDFGGDFVDWVELKNKGGKKLKLSKIYLSDNLSDPKKWRFPSVKIASDSFVVVYASGKKIVVDEEVHTNFKISSKGAFLYLFF